MADAGGAWAKVGVDVAAMLAQGAATAMKIDEGISDYANEISNINARVSETKWEAQRRIAQTKVEGVTGLKEMSKEAAFESGMANTQAQMVASTGKAKLGASGVRAAGSPLLAQEQQAKMAREAAVRKTESGNFGVSFGGLKLGGQLADINAQASLTTSEYMRQRAEARRRKKYLEDNRLAMIAISTAGGAPGFIEDFFRAI